MEFDIDRPRWRENVPFWAVHGVAVVGAIVPPAS